MKLLRPFIILFALLLGSIMAEAQPTPLNGQGLVYNSFTPYSGTNVVTLSLSAATSGNAALGITSPVNTPSVAWVQNTGSNPANVILGVGNTLTASLTTGTYLGAGTCMALNSIGATYVAGYSTLGTTLTVTMGVGNPAGSCGGAGGGGSGGTSSSFGAAFPATGTAVGMSQGGNMVALTGTAGNLNVQCANCSGSGVSAVDEAAFTAGTSLFAPGGGFFQTTATNNPLTTGQQGAFQVTANRALFTNLRNAAGTEVGTAGAPLQVSLANTASATVAIGKVDPNTIATWGLAAVTQNVAAPTNGLLGLCQFTTTPATISTTNVSPIQCDNANNVLVKVSNATTALVANADGVTPASTPANSPVNSYEYVYNGSTFDRVRTFSGLTGVAAPAGGVYLASLGSGATGGHLAGLISCDSHVFKHITTATDTMFVQGVASQSIYVCSWRSRAAGTATWLFETEADQSASCNGTLAQMNGIATEAVNTGETWGGNFWSGLKGASGFGVCAKSTGTGGVDVDLWYAQF